MSPCWMKVNVFKKTDPKFLNVVFVKIHITLTIYPYSLA